MQCSKIRDVAGARCPDTLQLHIGLKYWSKHMLGPDYFNPDKYNYTYQTVSFTILSQTDTTLVHFN